MPSRKIDTFDVAILRILQNDSKLPHHEIGELVNLSAPSVQRRIRRMENEGIISSVVSIVNPNQVGLNVTMVVEIELVSESKEKNNDIKDVFLGAPEIQQCYYVAGEVDFILIVIVQNMQEYEELADKLFLSNKNINKFRTFVALDRVKSSHRLNI